MHSSNFALLEVARAEVVEVCDVLVQLPRLLVVRGWRRQSRASCSARCRASSRRRRQPWPSSPRPPPRARARQPWAVPSELEDAGLATFISTSGAERRRRGSASRCRPRRDSRSAGEVVGALGTLESLKVDAHEHAHDLDHARVLEGHAGLCGLDWMDLSLAMKRLVGQKRSGLGVGSELSNILGSLNIWPIEAAGRDHLPPRSARHAGRRQDPW